MKPLSGNLWPAHPKPFEHELLSSWIVRIARSNGLKLQTFCDRVFGKEHQLWNRDIDRFAPEWLLHELSQRTGTPMDHVRKTTLRIYEGRLYSRWHKTGQLRWILCAGMYHRKRRRFGIQFCSRCLAEDPEPYFRTYWRVAVLTFCPVHGILLHDRCPKCGSAIAFHRRELGRPETIEAGPMCLCHTCQFDLRYAPKERFVFCESSVRAMLETVADHVLGQASSMDLGKLDALHQLCKILVSKRKHVRLGEYIAAFVSASNLTATRGRFAFERRAIAEREQVIQLAAWVLARPQRMFAAWQAGCVRYSDFLRDFGNPPDWYIAVVETMNEKRLSQRH